MLLLYAEGAWLVVVLYKRLDISVRLYFPYGAEAKD